MQEWQFTLQSALLGIHKMPFKISNENESLTAAIETIQANTAIEKEEQFLQIAALIHQYTIVGTELIKHTNNNITIAENETANYCSTIAHQLLIDAFSEKYDYHIELWLKQCSSKKQIVHPQIITQLLQKAVSQKSIKKLVIECIGKRGLWLCNFNKEWQAFTIEVHQIDVWQTGSLAERKQLLQDTCKENVQEAMNLLQSTWSQENASTKTSFLEIIDGFISGLEDCSWLEGILTEKSITVKSKVLSLLKKNPSSSIIKSYEAIVANAISLRKEKILLGLSSKQIIHIQLSNPLPPEIIATGIEPLSNSKTFTDDVFILFQLLQYTPPDFLEASLQLNAASIISYFHKQENLQQYLPAIIHATIIFNNANWANSIVQQTNTFHVELIKLLPIEEQEKYSIQFFKENEWSIIENALQWQQEWGVDFTYVFLKYVSEYPSFPTNYLHKSIACIASKNSELVSKFSPNDTYAADVWLRNKETIIRLLHLKQNIIQSFQ
ncbi:MAG: DUF5691 domain-containing protein [Chitinophagaceae bacterium]